MYRDLMHRLQQGTCDQDVDYHLTKDRLVMFRDIIYVPYSSEIKKIILREFHANSYLCHPGYHKTLTTVKTFCY